MAMNEEIKYNLMYNNFTLMAQPITTTVKDNYRDWLKKYEQ